MCDFLKQPVTLQRKQAPLSSFIWLLTLTVLEFVDTFRKEEETSQYLYFFPLFSTLSIEFLTKKRLLLTQTNKSRTVTDTSVEITVFFGVQVAVFCMVWPGL